MKRNFPTVDTWEKLQEAHEKLVGSGNRWVFRGQQQGWPLSTSLERVVHQRFGEPLSELRRIERRVIREFKRHFHRYSAIRVDDDDDLRWLGLMQHHGAPTRLLDWTYSFYIALYNAAEAAIPSKHVGVIWAIDLDWCWRVAESVVPIAVKGYRVDDKDRAVTRDLLATDATLVLPLTPFGLDERIAVQQGLFLAPLDMRDSFEANLDAMAGSGDGEENVRGIRLAWDQGFLTTTITELQRMNINRRSLYPGLDGLAVGLHNWIATLHLMPLHQDRAGS